MKLIGLTTAALLAVVAFTPLHAQDFIAKSPTAADWAAMAKLPDFNGVWEQGGGGARGGGAPAAGAPAAAPGRGAPAAAPPAGGARAGGAPGAGAGPGRGAAGGRGGRGGAQFTPEYEAKRLAAARGPAPEDSQTANCLPPGMPGIMTQPYPMEFLVTPGKVTIVIEAYTQVRHIYTDGRMLPADPDPKFFGTSIGRWEGSTLAVETVGFNDHVQLARGVPHSDQMKIAERFTLVDPDTMTIETTITDPPALAQPYVTRSTLRRHRNWTISQVHLPGEQSELGGR